VIKDKIIRQLILLFLLVKLDSLCTPRAARVPQVEQRSVSCGLAQSDPIKLCPLYAVKPVYNDHPWGLIKVRFRVVVDKLTGS
jgi:hypothetical protein